MHPSQFNRREGLFPCIAAEALLGKEGCLVKIVDGGTIPKIALPTALTDDAFFLLVDAKNGLIGEVVDVEPLDHFQEIRVRAKGSGSAGGRVSLADPAVAADAGKVIAAPGGAATIIGIAYEDWTDGQLLCVYPIPQSQAAGAGGDPVVGGDLSGTAGNAQIVAGAVTDAEVGAGAAIAQSKISGLATDLAAKAPLASPTFTGNPLAPTPAANDNDTSIATSAYVQSELTDYGSDTVAFTNKTVNGLTVTSTTGTLTMAAAKTLAVNNTITLVGTDGATYTFPSVSCDIGFREIPQNIQSAAYTLALTDRAGHVLHPSADTTARIFTIPANASVAFPLGAAITIINQNAAGVLTISITTDTLRKADTGATGSRTLAANGVATLIKIDTTEWIISGGSALT